MNEIDIRKKKAAAFIVIHQILNKKTKTKTKHRQRRWWITKLYQNKLHNNGSSLLSTLKFDESTGQFKNFLRMSSQDFETLINMVGPKIQKSDTRFRKAIPVKERLAVTLRFLATGDSYTSLQYLFGMSKQIISLIIPEVCEALIEGLQDNIKVKYIII
ncbi:unnamed protein product [Macrosiphum euphorbiae]|uniref:Protein ANTAGONIST OF LIKE HETEROCHROMATIN PROTEIN 1-like n=1 Tax=Macrosiphum euphorbiae TaxID=13131 RepID=A0AAV0XZ67_9HEMI|nr:unnamed protein product [Macrosiphum euphorbiae]